MEVLLRFCLLGMGLLAIALSSGCRAMTASEFSSSSSEIYRVGGSLPIKESQDVRLMGQLIESTKPPVVMYGMIGNEVITFLPTFDESGFSYLGRFNAQRRVSWQQIPRGSILVKSFNPSELRIANYPNVEAYMVTFTVNTTAGYFVLGKYKEAKLFAESMYQCVTNQLPKNNVQNNNEPDIEERLLKLKSLLDRGLITEEDYDQRKSEMLEDL